MRDVVQRFLGELWGTKDAERGWILLWDALYERKESRLTDHFIGATRTAAEAASHVDARLARPRREFYTGVCLRNFKPEGRRRGGSKDTEGVCGLWAEIDVAGPAHASPKAYPPTEKAALELLNAAGLKPTILIRSGHGLHAWWLFTDTWYFDNDTERQKFATLARAWQETIAAHATVREWAIDSTSDLARVLRVAGTENCKDEGDPIPVEVIDWDGPRYNDWAPFEERSQPVDVPARTRTTTKDYTVANLTLDDGANPPIEKLELLKKASKKFRLTWERKRTDFSDQSASAYCFSLAYHAIEARWTDQEVIDLLISWRRGQSESLKTDRPDWYFASPNATIPKARRAVEKNVDVERAIEMLSAETADVEINVKEIKDSVSKIVGARLKAFIQHGEEDAHYSFVLEDEKTIRIGSAEQLFNVRYVRARLFERSGVILPAWIKQETWFSVVSKMNQIKEIENPEVGERKEQLREWVEDYLSSSLSVYSDAGEEGWQPAVVRRMPFARHDQGYIYVHADALRAWLDRYRQTRVEKTSLLDDLRYAGWQRHTVNNGKLTKSYWRYQLAVFKLALKDSIGDEFSLNLK